MMNRRQFSILLANAVAVGGIDSLEAAPYPVTGPRDTRLLRLLAFASTVKIRGYASSRALAVSDLLTLQAANPLALNGFFGAGIDGALRIFFATALVYVGHAQSAKPVLGFHSPVLDLWWLLEMSNGTAPVALRSAFVHGGAIGGKPVPDELPLFVETRTRSVAEALRSVARMGANEFRRQFPQDSTSDPVGLDQILASKSGNVVAERLLVQMNNLSQFGDDTNLFAALKTVQQALRPELALKLPAGLQGQAAEGFTTLAGLPLVVRGGLVPIAAFQIDRMWLVISGNASSGRLLIMSMLDPSAPHALIRLGLIDVLPGSSQ